MSDLKKLPVIIQGGMGIGVSNWRLAKSVSEQGQMGVVSGTAIAPVVARRLQRGDADGAVRRALLNFPWPEMACNVLETYFIEGGKSPETPFKPTPLPSMKMNRSSVELMIVANFAEVFLAKEGHNGLVGVNYLEKIQLPTLPSLFGAMLAGVDFVLMGAGIPLSIPGILDGLSRWEEVELKLQVDNNTERRNYSYHFDPKEYCQGDLPSLVRPRFLAVVSSDIVAMTMARKASGEVDGFVVEGHTAGGHNAPPRKTKELQAQAEPQYGPKDIPDLAKIQSLGKPFWLAGGYASPAKLKEALDAGASGVQVGTAFAFCDESSFMPEIKKEAIRQCRAGTLKVITDFNASPTGYPFKSAQLEIAKDGKERERVCDLGYLRQLYCNGESGVGYRCPGEPVEHYVRKGGCEEETAGKLCLCNRLLAAVGLGQVREDGAEVPLVTAGEDFSTIIDILGDSTATSYSAKEVIDYIIS